MSPRRLLAFAIAAALTIGCDHATKVAATTLLGSDRVVSLAFVRFETVRNAGAFLSLGSDLPGPVREVLFLGLVPVLVACASLAILRSRAATGRATLAAALVAGGGLSNWIDRLAHSGLVTDFASLGVGPLHTGIFNLADCAVVAGALLLLAPRRSGGAERRGVA